MQAHMMLFKAALARKNEFAIEYEANPFGPPPLPQSDAASSNTTSPRNSVKTKKN